MNPQYKPHFVGHSPLPKGWGALPWLLAILFFLSFVGEADAQRRRRRRKRRKKPAPTKPVKKDDAPAERTGPAAAKESDAVDPSADPDVDKTDENVKVKTKETKNSQVFDFSGMALFGSERKPQLLYFLERANEELERASLERRSFIPEMVRSLDEEAL